MARQDYYKLDGVHPSRTIDRATGVAFRYILTLTAWIVCIGIFGGNVGYGFIMWIGLFMWGLGAVTAFIVREQEEPTAKRTRGTIFSWSMILIVYREFIERFVTLTPQDWSNALNVNVPVPISENAISWTSMLLIIMLVAFPVQYGWWTYQLYSNHQGRKLFTERFAEIQRKWHMH